MPYGNTAGTECLTQQLLGTDQTWDGNTNFWLAFYTASVTAGQTITTNEATFTGYARIPLIRASAFTIGTKTFSNADLIQFAECTANPNTIVAAVIVSTASGAGQIIYFDDLNTPRDIVVGNQAQFNIGEITFVLT